MDTGALGKAYTDGQIIIHQGEMGDCMYVIQEGEVEVLQVTNGHEIHLAQLKAGDFFGEMAIFEREVRSATVRALGSVRILTIDQKNFLRRIHQDPSLAYRMVQVMSHRIREMNKEITRLKSTESLAFQQD